MNRFKNILCVLEKDPGVRNILERAVSLAENNQARLTVVQVIDDIPPYTKLYDRALFPEIKSAYISSHQEVLKELVVPWNRSSEIQTKILTGISFLEIIRVVLRNKHDLVIKMTESAGLIDQVFASDDMHLLRKCPCPLWLVKPKSSQPYQRILAAVNVENFCPPEEVNTRQTLNLQILEMASSLALEESADLHIIHVWRAIGESIMRGGFTARPEADVAVYVEEERERLNRNFDVLMSRMQDKLGRDALEYLKPKKHLIKGDPRKNIPEFAKKIQADLVVMGTVARTGLPGYFIGNTAESILNQLKCSVLAIKPSGFVSPVSQ